MMQLAGNQLTGSITPLITPLRNGQIDHDAYANLIERHITCGGHGVLVNGTTAEMTARLTVGKKLSRNLLAVYSTNLGTQREHIFRVEWDVSADFTLIGLRNDLGKVSFDLRYRTRF